MIANAGRGLAIATAAVALFVGGRGAAQSVPIDHSGKPQAGVASFYSPKESGKTTASGAPLQPEAMTAASRTLPLGTKAQVVNKENGRAVTVTINDRGPYVDGRVVDVTPKAAEKLGMTEQGLAGVEVKPLSEPPAKPPVQPQ